ncbi:hypothetical protein P7K49_004545 [Saguinus oedipus]|uniref:Myosin motor domain-containing protein n=1 Tax=Saguinus oedipus TaxID=9490 RepID=A0ABQ9W7Q5_SAGOE|nr:hypothetical protein P7K49_004545 [Saguinus oedipus]
MALRCALSTSSCVIFEHLIEQKRKLQLKREPPMKIYPRDRRDHLNNQDLKSREPHLWTFALICWLHLVGILLSKDHLTTVFVEEIKYESSQPTRADGSSSINRCEGQLQNQFDQAVVLNQLRYSGMLETVRIRKAGYAVRRPFQDFYKRQGELNGSSFFSKGLEKTGNHRRR